MEQRVRFLFQEPPYAGTPFENIVRTEDRDELYRAQKQKVRVNASLDLDEYSEEPSDFSEKYMKLIRKLRMDMGFNDKVFRKARNMLRNKNELSQLWCLYNLQQETEHVTVDLSYENRVITLYFRVSDLYFIAFEVKDIIYEMLEEGKDSAFVPAAKPLKFGVNYADMNVEMNKLPLGYNALTAAFNELYKAGDVGDADLHKLKKSVMRVCFLFSEAVRFHNVAQHVKTRIEIGTDSAISDMGDIVHEWSTKKGLHDRFFWCCRNPTNLRCNTAIKQHTNESYNLAMCHASKEDDGGYVERLIG